MAVKKLSTLESRVAALATLRAERDAIAASLKAADAAVEEAQTEVLNSLIDSGLESVRSGAATVSVKRTTVPTVTDWVALDAYILKHKSLDMLQRRIAVGAWRERVEQGKDVPGVVAFERVDLNWRTAK